jgi:hypothetical protein
MSEGTRSYNGGSEASKQSREALVPLVITIPNFHCSDSKSAYLLT